MRDPMDSADYARKKSGQGPSSNKDLEGMEHHELFGKYLHHMSSMSQGDNNPLHGPEAERTLQHVAQKYGIHAAHHMMSSFEELAGGIDGMDEFGERNIEKAHEHGECFNHSCGKQGHNGVHEIIDKGDQ